MSDLEWHENKKLRRMEVAAPQMLAALKSLMDAMPRSQDRPPGVSIGQWYAARAAIAEAEGEAHEQI
jgi:hypothetical protein